MPDNQQIPEKKVTVHMPESAAKKLRIVGINTNRSLSQIVEEALLLWWAENGYGKMRGVEGPLFPSTDGVVSESGHDSSEGEP